MSISLSASVIERKTEAHEEAMSLSQVSYRLRKGAMEGWLIAIAP